MRTLPPSVTYHPSFKLFPTSPPSTHSFCCLVSLTECVTLPDLMLFYFVILWTWTCREGLGTLVPAAPCCVFYATRNQIYQRFDKDDMVFASFCFLISHTHIHTEKKTQRTQNILTHTYKYIINTTCSVHTAVTCITLNE